MCVEDWMILNLAGAYQSQCPYSCHSHIAKLDYRRYANLSHLLAYGSLAGRISYCLHLIVDEHPCGQTQAC